ncbi:MAG: recombinase family protein [Oscillospiraceae bacterium]
MRLVAVSDGVDSDEGDNEFTPFRNIMNEWYAKDISKKRKIVNKMKGNAGIPLSQPPYGYIKNPDDPRFWVIDPEAADVVRRIYDMALEGYGLAEIASALGKDGIVNPTYYWRNKGVKTQWLQKYRWSLPNGDIPPSRKSSPCRNTAAMSSTSKATPNPTR